MPGEERRASPSALIFHERRCRTVGDGAFAGRPQAPQDEGGSGIAGCGAVGAPSSFRWQAAKWSSPVSFSAGVSTRQRSKTKGQRVWKRQPLGGLAGLGTSPLSTMRLGGVVGSGRGTAESSAFV